MENQVIEWKRQWDDEFLKWICAFANTKGGTLEIGRDNNGEVVGLSNAQKLMEDLPNKIRQAVGIVADVELKHENGLTYIKIFVNAYGSPISCRGKYYYRSGSTTQELSGAALDDFLLRTQGKTWDSFLIPNVTVSDLQTDAIKIFRKKALSSRRLSEADLDMSDDELIESLLLKENDVLKRAAILLFHENPERFVLGAFVKIAYIAEDIVFHDEIHGPIVAMPDKIMDLMYTKYFKQKITYEGIQRIETYPVPRGALREAIINAIIHKDYTSNNPIQIRVYEDKVEIDNEGKLPESWTIEDLKKKHKSKPHNPLLATAFFRSGMIEAWGRGIERINSALRDEGKADIEYDYNGSDMVAIFNTSVQTDCTDNCTDKAALNDTEKAVLNLIRKNPNVTTTEIAAELKVVRRTVSNAIKRLKELGIVKREGSDRAGFWAILKQ
jgi:ATP-dependent DNA helicase RecG